MTTEPVVLTPEEAQAKLAAIQAEALNNAHVLTAKAFAGLGSMDASEHLERASEALLVAAQYGAVGGEKIGGKP